MLNFCKFFFEKTFKKDKTKLREPSFELIFSFSFSLKRKKNNNNLDQIDEKESNVVFIQVE
jgi:hypothetical protein